MKEGKLEKFNIQEIKRIANAFKKGKIAIMPTETIPGLICSALSKKAVERMMAIKNRPAQKPPTIIISDLNQLSLLGIKTSVFEREVLSKIWPASISFVLSCPNNSKKYLHQGLNSLAVRLPRKKWLCQLLQIAGPIATTSANLADEPFAKTVLTGVKIFSQDLDFYVIGGKTSKTLPSTVVQIDSQNKTINILRKGADAKKIFSFSSKKR